MNNEDFDLEKFVDMFDTAMNSDNPTVQKCFNNLLMVISLAHAHEEIKPHPGPLRKLITDVSSLTTKVESLEHTIQILKSDIMVNNSSKYNNMQHTPYHVGDITYTSTSTSPIIGGIFKH